MNAVHYTVPNPMADNLLTMQAQINWGLDQLTFEEVIHLLRIVSMDAFRDFARTICPAAANAPDRTIQHACAGLLERLRTRLGVIPIPYPWESAA